MKFVNLTPHAIHVENLVIEPSGIVARCTEKTITVGSFLGISLVKKEYGIVENLPEPEGGTMFLVSMMVRLALPEREDLSSPGDLIRDEKGMIIGSKNLVVN